MSLSQVLTRKILVWNYHYVKMSANNIVWEDMTIIPTHDNKVISISMDYVLLLKEVSWNNDINASDILICYNMSSCCITSIELLFIMEGKLL